MKSVGIICEYNPFHHGHARQMSILHSKFGPETNVVCVMSGNYVQRGVPAMWDKFTRARAAAACGADLVLELPVTRVLQSAEGFAFGGVEILTKLGCVDYLCFGAENSETDFLSLAQKMDAPDSALALRQCLDQGLSYAAARQYALQDDEGVLSKPNNILGFEYCRAITKLSSSLKPVVIERNGNYHATTAQRDAPSAMAVRSLFPSGPWDQYVPREVGSILKDAPWYDIRFGERAMLARLRGLRPEEWATCAHGGEGLWSKMMKAVQNESTIEAILSATKSKRYPRSRLQRLLLCAYLGIHTADLNAPVPYVRVLAASESGRSLLRTAKKNGQLKLVNPGKLHDACEYFAMEARTSDLYTLFSADGFPCPSAMEQCGKIYLQNK